MIILAIKYYKWIKYRFSPEYKRLNELMKLLRSGQSLNDTEIAELKSLIENEQKYG